LVVEDDAVCRSLFVDLLTESGFSSVTACADGREALHCLDRADFDIVLTDLNMPILTGQTLVREALRVRPDLTVLVVSGQATVQGAVQLIKDGVFDFLAKPFSVDEFKAMIDRALPRIDQRRLKPILISLLTALEQKDVYLKGHSERVARLAARLAKLAGLTARRIELLEQVAMVHDVGKIGISEQILNRPGPLTAEERREIEKHPLFTGQILTPLPELAPGIPFVRHHHEHYDGKGYPDGLRGEEIPLEARIIAVADAFDAMNSDRAYRAALPMAEIIRRLRRAGGTQLDPDMTDLFLGHLPELGGTEGAS
jgi:putative two-component system response regulator